MAKATATATAPGPTPRLQERYHEEIVPQLAKKLGRTNPHSIPQLEKIVVSMGVSAAMTDKKHMEEAVDAMTEITARSRFVARRRRAMANFRVREGMDSAAK